MDHKILIVDDDPLVLKLLDKYLCAAGHSVLSATNGREALRIILNEGASVVISDWTMPEMTGVELCRAIRSVEGIGFVYMIVMTAHTERNRVIEAFDTGANDFIVKPFQRQELLARVNAGMRIVTLEADLMKKQREIQKTNAELTVLNRILEQMATTDELTRLPNRREAMNSLKEYWPQVERHDQPLACIMLDIDHFKRCNDTYGHDVGDLVLRETARVLEWTTRGGERVFRLGGEEFLVLCPSSTIEEVAQAAERLRRVVESNVIECEDLKLKITISAGVAGNDDRMTEPDDLLKRADEALYAAKRAGRNVVSVASQTLVASAAEAISS